ncbi:hypothetical protein TNCV_322851 [Trichonephila clavipes]|nr:hypothetical protein TNCV_322851 [Trichonephila clavipes]
MDKDVRKKGIALKIGIPPNISSTIIKNRYKLQNCDSSKSCSCLYEDVGEDEVETDQAREEPEEIMDIKHESAHARKQNQIKVRKVKRRPLFFHLYICSDTESREKKARHGGGFKWIPLEKHKVLDESRSFFRVHTGYFSNIPKCIKAEFIASWACSQSSVVSSSQR